MLELVREEREINSRNRRLLPRADSVGVGIGISAILCSYSRSFAFIRVFRGLILFSGLTADQMSNQTSALAFMYAPLFLLDPSRRDSHAQPS